jgi:hypothetical protein
MNSVAKFGDWLLSGEQELGGKTSQGQNGLRTNGVKLTPKKRTTTFNLIRLRIAVSRRSAFDHVTNVDLISPPSHGCDDFVEQLASGAYKRATQPVLFLPGSFPYQYYSCCRVSLSKNNMGPMGVKTTAAAFTHIRANHFQVCREILG